MKKILALTLVAGLFVPVMMTGAQEKKGKSPEERFAALDKDNNKKLSKEEYLAPYDAEKKGKLRLIASPDARDGSVKIHQDADVYATVLAKGDKVEHKFKTDRFGWLHVAKGEVELNGEKLVAGDGAAIAKEDSIQIASGDADRSEVLLFDLA